MVDIDELKEKFLNLEFDTTDLVVDAARSATVARTSGEVLPEFTDPEHEDFQVYPSIVAAFASGRHLPIEFPKMGGIPMDGGKAVQLNAPVRAGVPLTGRTHLHDIYAKQGRSGRMVFVVARMQIYDEAGAHLATSDSRMVIRERPDE